MAAFMLTFLLSMLTAHMQHEVVLIATSSEGGAYHHWGDEYADELRRAAVRTDVLLTSGSVENIRLLHEGKVQVALIQGGLLREADRADLESLGTVAYEPLWLWMRAGSLASIGDLGGRTIAVGARGSGTEPLARLVLAQYGIDDRISQLRELSTAEGHAELVAGTVDAMFVVAPIEALDIQRLIDEPSVVLLPYPNAEAFIRVSPVLHKVVFPAGARSLARGLPPRDIDLLAPKASVVVRKDLNQNVKYLLLLAMRQIHSAPKMFTASNEFPAPEAIGLRLADLARAYYAGQLGLAYQLLPFWLADLTALMIASMIPTVVVLYPILVRVLKARRAQMTKAETGTKA